MAKKNDKIKVSFVDSMSSEDVTGSMVLITTPKHKILLDAGLHQTNDRYEDFLINNRRFKEFKPKDLDYVFISHIHIDHVGMVPRLYACGFTGRTIMSSGCGAVLKDMMIDCAEICERDILFVNNQHGKNYESLYGIDDVHNMLNNTYEYDHNQRIVLDDELSFELIPNGHLIGSCQILLYVKIDGITKKILYTGDIGNKVVDNKFVGKYQQVEHADLVIGEATYGDRPDVRTGNKERRNDMDKMRTAIDTQVHQMKGRVVIPVFANSRCQSVALMIHELYKDSEWKPKVYIDSPLAVKMFEDYAECLTGDDKKIFDEMVDSGLLTFVKDPIDSKTLVGSNEPCVVLSSAGFCQVGRVRHHLKKCLPDPNATILFVGYASPDSLAGMIRDPYRRSVIIDQKIVQCRASVFSLKSLSGHAPFDQLVDDYSSIKCQKVVLHHGAKESKEGLKAALEKAFEKKCQSTRVVVSNSSLKFSL